MKCPECQKQGLKSIVYVGLSYSTLVYSQPYYDEDGKYHYHDMNTYTTNYSCSNGHTWQEKAKNYCLTCGELR